MRRRELIAIISGAVLCLPLRTTAQQRATAHRIGVLTLAPRLETPGPLFEAFKEGLSERGYIEGRNTTFEIHYAEGKIERLPALAADLVAANVDVIVVTGPGPVQAAKAATTKIPIVMIAGSSDPIGEGIIASYAKPGGNITGTTYAATPERFGKQLELLRQVIGHVSRVAVLWDLDVELFHRSWKPSLDDAANRLDLKIVGPVVVRGPGDFNAAFGKMSENRVDAILVASGGVIFAHRTRVGELAIKSRLPTMAAFKEFTQAGGLVSYGPDFLDIYRRAARYVDEILRGANPGDLPIEQPAKYHLALNLATAKALSIKVPDAMIAVADEVIE